MTLTTTFKSKGREYSLALDTDAPARDCVDENYAEWVVEAEDGRILEVTVWKDGKGRLSRDGMVKVYRHRKDYGIRLLLDKKDIRILI